MSRRALIVGINNFSRPDYTLRGCINDTVEMKSILTTYYEFKEKDIRVIHDGDARADDIRAQLSWLLSEYDGNDVRVFHISSHGTQVDDDSGDEWEAADEVIVPYDHDWGNPFRDDELKSRFDEIPEGVNFTFIADCCHSGTIQRALIDKEIDFRPRFVTPPREVSDRIVATKQKRDAEGDAWAAEELAKMLQRVPPDQWSARMMEYLPQLRRRFRENKFGFAQAERHFLLAACEDRQTAADALIDGEYRGAFTWSLARAITESEGKLTYGELIKRAGANLRDYEQIAQLECPEGVRDIRLFTPLAQHA